MFVPVRTEDELTAPLLCDSAIRIITGNEHTRHICPVDSAKEIAATSAVLNYDRLKMKNLKPAAVKVPVFKQHKCTLATFSTQ